MITYILYYFVVGKTYSAGDLPHSIEVSELAMYPVAMRWMKAVEDAIEILHTKYHTTDQYHFIKIEQKDFSLFQLMTTKTKTND